MKTLLTNIGSLVRVSNDGSLHKRGSAMQDISVLSGAAMLFDESILWIGPNERHTEMISAADSVVDCAGRVVIPGFVDSHTHVVFAGNRSDEFARRLRGVSYQQIASEGGGILSTMRAVRSATEDNLYEQGMKLAQSAMEHGTTTLEIKSGYALDTEGELKMLRAIKRIRQELPLTIVATFLGAHDVPPEYAHDVDSYVDVVCNSMIPAVVSEQLADICDVFCDTGYFTVEQSRRILNAARSHGMRTKVHADELSTFGAAELAVECGSLSADHLLFVSEAGIQALASSHTVATVLPGTAYTLRLPYAPAAKLMDAGAIVALATDCNPGSCYSENMQGMMSLACANMRMSVEQCMNAATLNGAFALGLSDKVGSLELGKQADVVVLNTHNIADIVYHFGVNHVAQTWIRGHCVVQRTTHPLAIG